MSTKAELLEMPIWSSKEIKEYFNCSNTKAYEIKVKAIKAFGGQIPYNAKYIKSESVLNVFGTTRLFEMDLLKREKIWPNEE
ncbi:MAG: hypothetical protein LKF69_04460 [Bacilli bacterium]|jgi:hypothetical protein|nr:hypothetical protein [Bacilli bacterium]MCH4236031.1 hypothetical protein [Bacilli bacterium]